MAVNDRRSLLPSHVALALAYRARQREQWHSPEALGRLRVQRLRRLAEIAVRAPYYRDVFAQAGVAPERIASEDVLQELPILEKQELRSRLEDLLTEEPDRLSPVTTTGSTGQPLRILRSARDQAQISAVWMRAQRAYGRRFHHSQVNIGSGRSAVRHGPVVALQKLRLLPGTFQLSSFDPIERQIAFLRNVRPGVISAYAVALEILADAIVERGITDIRPAIILSGGMELTERCRSLAARAFGRPVFDTYAAQEAGCMAWECPSTPGLLHLNEDVQIIEIVDEEGRPVPEGEGGQVVVTQLHSTALPVIRYRIGDLAPGGRHRCACGRGFGSITEIAGRVAATLRSSDGRTLNNLTVSSILGRYHEIRRYQVRQLAPDDLLITVVPGQSWTPESSDAIIRGFKERLGDAFCYRVSLCDDIPLAQGGKFQTIVPLPQDDAALSSASERVET